MPFGLGQTKPHHFLEMARVVWENRDNLGYAWRILRHGVCDGCSLGPRGLRDDAIPGIHLCMVRLKMLRANTMPPLDPAKLGDAAALRKKTGRELREMGRLPYPMLRRAGEKGFRRISWTEALRLAGERLRAADPHRMAIYTTSRGMTNESYYAAAKAARLLGSNNIDNAARMCHAASTVALKQSLGVGASTVSYTDWLGADLIVLLGSHIANNQPVATKYLYHAKKNGARILVVNPFREPALERYWIPSIVKSAIFGTRLADAFYLVRAGGDIAFLNGVLKWLIAMDAVDHAFLAAHTTGWEELRAAIEAQSWEMLEAAAGLGRETMRAFAEEYAAAKNAVFIWSMGLTQHFFGVQNVLALVNVALARGMLGRPNAGLVPIRGHSGVQGAAECGCAPNTYPGGTPVNPETARRFSEHWGKPMPDWPGLSAPEMLEAAARGELDVFHVAGGNFLETMPGPEKTERALGRVACRIHQDLFVNSSMLVDPPAAESGKEGIVLLLPAQTRYEQPGGGTLTSTERRIRFSPEITRPRIGEARPEYEIFLDLAAHALGPQEAHLARCGGAAQLRAEMEKTMPLYRGIGGLANEGESVQYGGPLLCAGGVCANLPGGRARLTVVAPPDLENTSGAGDAARQFYLTTRRGKQFNSMVWGETDPLTGSRREDVLVSRGDAARLGVADGAAIRLVSACGKMTGRCRVAELAPGTLQAHWPEANVLLPSRVDPASREPDYNTWVTLEKV